MSSRRRVLATVGLGIGSVLTGCSAVPAPRPQMDLGVSNYRERAVEVSVELLREDAEQSQARVYRNTVTLDGVEGDDRTWSDESVAPSRAYRVELRVDPDGTPVSTAHYHYRPDCASGDDVGLNVNVRTNGVTVDQSACSGDAPFV